jgi:DNA sulfur modification protein DndC
MKARNLSLFEESRLHLRDSIELSLDSLREYGRRYEHWATAYSGGKDSSATVTFIAWAIREGHVPAPKTWTVLGNKREQVRQLGNAVTPPVMKQILQRCAATFN